MMLRFLFFLHRKSPGATTRNVRPRLEAFEDRFLPSVTSLGFLGEGSDPRRYVVMTDGDLSLKFDTYQGGAPLKWQANGSLLTEPFPGAGTSINWEQGQDPTQA